MHCVWTSPSVVESGWMRSVRAVPTTTCPEDCGLYDSTQYCCACRVVPGSYWTDSIQADLYESELAAELGHHVSVQHDSLGAVGVHGMSRQQRGGAGGDCCGNRLPLQHWLHGTQQQPVCRLRRRQIQGRRLARDVLGVPCRKQRPRGQRRADGLPSARDMGLAGVNSGSCTACLPPVWTILMSACVAARGYYSALPDLTWYFINEDRTRATGSTNTQLTSITVWHNMIQSIGGTFSISNYWHCDGNGGNNLGPGVCNH